MLIQNAIFGRCCINPDKFRNTNAYVDPAKFERAGQELRDDHRQGSVHGQLQGVSSQGAGVCLEACSPEIEASRLASFSAAAVTAPRRALATLVSTFSVLPPPSWPPWPAWRCWPRLWSRSWPPWFCSWTASGPRCPGCSLWPPRPPARLVWLGPVVSELCCFRARPPDRPGSQGRRRCWRNCRD